jgi:hypothetical protein
MRREHDPRLARANSQARSAKQLQARVTACFGLQALRISPVCAAAGWRVPRWHLAALWCCRQRSPLLAQPRCQRPRERAQYRGDTQQHLLRCKISGTLVHVPPDTCMVLLHQLLRILARNIDPEGCHKSPVRPITLHVWGLSSEITGWQAPTRSVVCMGRDRPTTRSAAIDSLLRGWRLRSKVTSRIPSRFPRQPGRSPLAYRARGEQTARRRERLPQWARTSTAPRPPRPRVRRLPRVTVRIVPERSGRAARAALRMAAPPRRADARCTTPCRQACSERGRQRCTMKIWGSST